MICYAMRRGWYTLIDKYICLKVISFSKGKELTLFYEFDEITDRLLQSLNLYVSDEDEQFSYEKKRGWL